jgi:DNA adenine methylase
MLNLKLKPPFTYYGGKQKLAKEIISRIPTDHKLYASVFAGGAAEFFAKEPSEVEVLNDINKELINFYKVVQSNFIELEKMIKISLHSRTIHSDASVIYNSPHLFSDVQRACQSFSSMLDGSWGYDKKKNTTSLKIHNKRVAFTEDYAIRLQNVQLECADALYIIQSRDTKDSFFYCDPPYYNSDCAHYKGYSQDDFQQLLRTLANIKGRFLLSSYPSEILTEYIKKRGWYSIQFDQKVSVSKGYGKKKTEVLTANYPLS